MPENTKIQKRNTKEAYIDALERIEFDITFTLDFEKYTTEEQVRSTIRWFWRKIDKMAFGNGGVSNRNCGLARVYVLDGAVDGCWSPTKKPEENQKQISAETYNAKTRVLEAGRAKFGKKNLHYHGVVKVGGKFEDAEALMASMHKLWAETRCGGKYPLIELVDKSRERGWHAYVAGKAVYEDAHIEMENVATLWA